MQESTWANDTTRITLRHSIAVDKDGGMLGAIRVKPEEADGYVQSLRTNDNSAKGEKVGEIRPHLTGGVSLGPQDAADQRPTCVSGIPHNSKDFSIRTNLPPYEPDRISLALGGNRIKASVEVGRCFSNSPTQIN